MTELEKMQYAKMYIDKLANGINPVDDTFISDNDIINNVRLSRCFFYVSDILRQVIENGGVTSTKSRSQKPLFYLTIEQRNRFVPSAKPIPVSEITKRLNDLADLETCKKLSYIMITNWLVNIGMLEMLTDSRGETKKIPTVQGNDLGISTETRIGSIGEYTVVLYDKNAQQFIVDNIEAIASFKKEKAI